MSRGALSMTKWFNTNYHFMVPEFHPDTTFSLHGERFFNEVKEAKALEYPVKAVLLEPSGFLCSGREKTDGFDRFSLLPSLLPVDGSYVDAIRGVCDLTDGSCREMVKK